MWDLDAAINLIKQFEGCSLTAYRCPAGAWTIGFGCTHGVYEGQRITQEDAELRLQEDVQETAQSLERVLKDKDIEVNNNQFNALVDFCYNLGIGAFSNSTMCRKLQARDYKGAAEEFPKWNKAGGKPLEGLTRRRRAEQSLFESRD